MRARATLLIAALIFSSCASLGLADDAADAKAIIAKAYAAVGGEKADKPDTATWKEEGTYYGQGDDGLPFTSSSAAIPPTKFRMEITGVFTIVINGDKGWTNAGGTTTEMTKEQLANQKEMQYSMRVCQIAPLVKEKGYQLKLLAPEKIKERPVVGVQVSHEGHRDVKLYFDKETYLVTKGQYRTHSEELGKEVEEEDLYSDYKEVGGRKRPYKFVVMRDGKKFVEATVTEFKPAEKLDDSLFEKP